MKAKILIGAIIIFCLVGISSVWAIEKSDKSQVAGRVEGNGTYFEVNDSEYLNISVTSSEPINLTLESIPEMVLMEFNGSTTSSQITISGFEPSTTYQMYEDDYHNLTTFTTDENGNYTYTQDLSKPHFVFIQPITTKDTYTLMSTSSSTTGSSNTIFIKDDSTGGDCTQIGTWNPSTKTCTLTTDVTETIQIDDDYITLEGNSHNVTGSGTGFGVYLPSVSYNNIKNLTIREFSRGFYLHDSSNNTIANNNVSLNDWLGIRLHYSDNNNIINNNLSLNWLYHIKLTYSSNNTIVNNNILGRINGIRLHYSDNNNIINNNLSNTMDVINLYYSNNNNIIDNNLSSVGWYGIIVLYSSNNTIANNNVSSTHNIPSYDVDGIYLRFSSNNNTIINNNVSSCNYYGIRLSSSSNNTIYLNNFISNNNNVVSNSPNTWNSTNEGAYIYNDSIFTNYLGNYWSDYSGLDTSPEDGIGDSPYIIDGDNDTYPLMLPFENYLLFTEFKEVIKEIDNYIRGLSDDSFKNNADKRKNALSNKLSEVTELIEAGEYQEAINKLQHDIRAKADGSVGGNPKNDWITDPEAQQEICDMIDNLVAQLETLL